MGLEDADDTFALPQVKELVEGLTDAIATFGGVRWQATNGEIERIAKPIARMVSRNVALRVFLARFCAPAVLVGAIGAYVMVRKLNATPAPDAPRSVKDGPAPAASPAGGFSPNAEPATPNYTPAADGADLSTDEQQRIAQQNQAIVLQLQRKTMAI